MAAVFCNLNLPFEISDLQLQFRNNRTNPTNVGSGLLRRTSYCSSPETFHKTRVTWLGLKHPRPQWRTLFKSNSDVVNVEAMEDEISMPTLIWRAVKLPIYSVALVPLTVGSAAAFWQTGLFSAGQFILLLASSIFVIAWLNLSNDVYDFDTGADKYKKESVVNIVGSRTGTLVAAYILLVLGLLGISWASLRAENLRAILLLASAITCGYIYQCPPFRLSYHGLGEPLCFAAFGPFATTAFYLLQGSQPPITGTLLSASVLVGLTTTLILFCSHFHQVKDDKAVGKMSPLVRLGTTAGSDVISVAVLILYSFLFIAGLSGNLPLTSVILCEVTIPIGRFIVSYVKANHKDNKKIFMSKYFCVRLHAAFGAALAAGLVAARLLARV
ncbi:OLC1v1002682C1 [Oldenlandia corymbosa var. corymbosa]|uniref:OLC1v1002682C1 n=1 Tax=Oldenlandia corymbosa var. corymbosa TaxID=529605 RepID=A0AAV1DAL5_OLDCO|nr:OLC1v1002682C1 [Oldenlandia corymbosa var. corymbosa]